MSCSSIHITFLRTFTKRVYSLPTRCWLPSSCTKQLVPLDILHIKNTGNDYNSGAASPYAKTMRKLRTHNARLRDSRSFSTKYGSIWTHLSATSLVATGKWWLCHWNCLSPRFIGSNLILLHPSLQWHSLCKTSSKVAWPHHLRWLSGLVDVDSPGRWRRFPLLCHVLPKPISRLYISPTLRSFSTCQDKIKATDFANLFLTSSIIQLRLKKKTSFHKLKNIFNPTNPEIPNTSPTSTTSTRNPGLFTH